MSAIPTYRFGPGAKEYLQAIINQIKQTRTGIPSSLAEKYATWTDLVAILRDLGTQIIEAAGPFRVDNHLTVEAIATAYRILNIPTSYRTFVISGANGLNHEPLRHLLRGYSFGEIDITTNPTWSGLLILEQKRSRWDRRAFQIKSWVKSLVDDSKRAITDKGRLYSNLKQLNPDLVALHMAKTDYTSNITSVDKVLIVKPVGDVGLIIGGGKDISIVTTTEQLRQVERELTRKYHTSPIASDYIPDPWLIQGRKCHFRMYLLVRSVGQSISGRSIPYAYSLWNRGNIITAAEPYRLEDFDNPRIHDTHMKYTDKDRYFEIEDPNYHEAEMTLDQRRFVFAQMQQIINVVGELMLNHTKSYPESVNGFEVFGIDFMVERNSSLNVMLIEINDHVGYNPFGLQDPESGPWSAEYTDFSARYWHWVFAQAIAPYFDLVD